MFEKFFCGRLHMERVTVLDLVMLCLTVVVGIFGLPWAAGLLFVDLMLSPISGIYLPGVSITADYEIKMGLEGYIWTSLAGVVFTVILGVFVVCLSKLAAVEIAVCPRLKEEEEDIKQFPQVVNKIIEDAREEIRKNKSEK